MKTLLVYYSLTGNCRRVAERIASALSADLEAVELLDPTDLKDGKLAGPAIMGGWFGRLPRIKPGVKDPSSYERIVFGAPVWVFRTASPIKAYITEHRGRLPKNAACFVCHGGLFGGSALRHLAGLCGAGRSSTLLLRESELHSGAWEPKADEFIGRLG